MLPPMLLPVAQLHRYLKVIHYKPGTALPMLDARVPAGFPSPAADYLQNDLSLDEYVTRHKAATFMFHIDGFSMIEENIYDGDIAIIDRSLTPENGDSIAAIIEDGFTIKKLDMSPAGIILRPANKDYSPIVVREGMGFQTFGVLTFTLHRHCRR